MSVETELKLRVPAASYAALARHPLLRAAGAGRRQRLRTVYYDTADGALWRAGLALRVRDEGGGRHTQTLKGRGEVLAGLHRRVELEVPLTTPQPDPARLPEGPWKTALLQALGDAPLVSACVTDFSRVVRQVAPGPDTCIEVCLDRGSLAGGGRREALCEIELELKQGSPAALYALALALAEDVPLAVENASKAERGYALFRDTPRAPTKAAPVALAADLTAGEAFVAVAGAVLAQIQANESGVLHEDDPEYVHQMRVGVRRLRSSFSVFAPLYAREAAAPLIAELRWLGAALGAARDLDVYLDAGLAPVAAAFPDHAGLHAYAQALRRAQRQARAAARRAIASRRYPALLLTLGAWLRALDTHSADRHATRARAQPVAAFATDVLESRYARLRKRGRGYDALTLDELHAVRIAAKKLRYAGQFFGALYPAYDGAALPERLSSLQDALGAVNDAATADLVIAKARVADGDVAAQAQAHGILLGWNRGRIDLLRAEARRAWQAVRQCGTYW